jgi:hypothetical protein
MNVEKYHKPMAELLGMKKTDFHVIKLQSTIYSLTRLALCHPVENQLHDRKYVLFQLDIKIYRSTLGRQWFKRKHLYAASLEDVLAGSFFLPTVTIVKCHRSCLSVLTRKDD